MGAAIPWHRVPRAPRERPVDEAFYARARWRKLRAAFLTVNPLCADPFREHGKAGRVVVAEHVDHLEPRLKRPDLAYDPANLQALCSSCHSRKTRTHG